MSNFTMENRKAKIRMAVLTVATAALSGLAASSAHADVIADYTFTGSSLSITAAGSSVAPNITASDVSSINGTAFTFPTSPTTASGTPAASLSSIFATTGPTGNGFAVTLTVAPGFSLDLSSISFYDQVSATGPSTGTVIINGATVGTVTNPTVIALFSVPVALTGLTGTVTFNLVGGGTAAGFATNGTSVAGSAGTFRIDDLTFNGTVTPVATPEPASIGVAAAGTGLLLTRRRRNAAK